MANNVTQANLVKSHVSLSQQKLLHMQTYAHDRPGCGNCLRKIQISVFVIILVLVSVSVIKISLVLTSMTLNDLERRNSPYFAFITEFDCLASQLRHSG